MRACGCAKQEVGGLLLHDAESTAAAIVPVVAHLSKAADQDAL